MNKQTIGVVIAAVVLFAIAVLGALAFTGEDSGAGNAHTMPDGQMMTGMMDSSMMGGQNMTSPMHTMSGGEQMQGMTQSRP